MIHEDISNRKTVSKRVPEIDTLYAYNTRHKAKFTHRQQSGAGYRYTSNRVLLQAGEGEIHIYHKTVTINGVSKGLTMITKCSKVRQVQAFFKDQATEIENNLELFKKFSHASATPTSLGIRFSAE